MESSSKQPIIKIHKILSLADLRENFELLDQQAISLESTPVNITRITLRLPSMMLVYHSSNMAVHSRTTLQESHVAYVAFGPQTAGTYNGVAISREKILGVPGGEQISIVTNDSYESIVVMIPIEHWITELKIRQRYEEVMIPNTMEFLVSNSEEASSSFSFSKGLFDVVESNPLKFENSKALCQAAENDLIENLLIALTRVEALQESSKDLTRKNHSQIVKQAEDYALSNYHGPICVSALCNAARVSERTLQYAFQNVMGMGPTTYLRRLFLHRAHEDLKREADLTVTDVATRWGFWHLGRFSQAYKKCFNELPSETPCCAKNDIG
jgi:AraC family ethanolamine operon transcriptional activator